MCLRQVLGAGQITKNIRGDGSSVIQGPGIEKNVTLELHCHRDQIWNPPGDAPPRVSVRALPVMFCWEEKTYFECQWHQTMGWDRTWNQKEQSGRGPVFHPFLLPDCRQDVTICFMLLRPYIPS